MQYTTYEKCVAIRRNLLRAAGEVVAYTRWSDDFAAHRIKETVQQTRQWHDDPDYFKVDPTDLLYQQCIELGFAPPSDQAMLLIPLWLHPYLTENFSWISITGKTGTKKPADNDHRHGWLTYGIRPKDYYRFEKNIRKI